MAVGKRRFGATGVEVAVVGQGTWLMGTPGARRVEVDAIRLGLELGMTHLDTAEMYGDGRAEEMLAEVLADGRWRRDELFLVSKVLPQHASHAGTIRACEASLKRLRTDYLDLYLLHWPGRHPIAETMRAMEDLAQAGKIRFLGVSNFDVEELEAARGALTRQPLAAIQVLYHLRARDIEGRLIPYCEQHGIAVVGYSPFGHGDFPSGGVLGEIAARHGKSERQVALAFLLRKTFVIPKAAQPEHVRENAGAAELRLSADEVRALERAFPYSPGGPLPTL
jgi:diketogulonate reductase-like aldo/keto reductase